MKQGQFFEQYLRQYFSGSALAEGCTKACLEVLNGNSGYRALKLGIQAAIKLEQSNETAF